MFPAAIGSIVFFLSGIFSHPGGADRLIKLLQEGDATKFAVYFNPSIQLTTPGKQGVYSRSQAKMILSEFFDDNKPSSAKLKTSGNSDNGAQYLSVDLITASGNYKVNISYRGAGENLKVHELKIEK